MKRQNRARWMTGAFALAVIGWVGVLPAADAQPNGRLQIHFMDVGQGDGALLISPGGETVLFDNGVRNNCELPLEYLRRLGIEMIDYHIASHYHDDHIGCTTELLDEFPLQVAAFDRGGAYNTRTYRRYAEAVNGKRRTVVPGSTITLDPMTDHSVVLTVVAVNATTVDGKVVDTTNENDLSVSVLIEYGNFDAEIGGDLSGFDDGGYEDIETAVAPKVGRLEVYKVHHHGSAYSTNQTWIETTTPQVGIVSCGDGNTHGHPTAQCMATLHNADVDAYWTERGNGTPPVAGRDVVGGTIVVEVSDDTDGYTVRYGNRLSKDYRAHEVGVAPPPSAPIYAWSAQSSIYHDATCGYVRNISPENLVTGAVPPAGSRPHPQCVR